MQNIYGRKLLECNCTHSRAPLEPKHSYHKLHFCAVKTPDGCIHSQLREKNWLFREVILLLRLNYHLEPFYFYYIIKIQMRYF